MSKATKFAEWIAESHYRLYNVENGVYEWLSSSDEVEWNFKTTEDLEKEFEEEQNQ